MIKIGLLFRDTSENRIKDYLKESSSFFVVKNPGLSSPDMTSLRKSLRSVNATLFVVKNSIARRALKSSGLENMISSVEGPCGLIFTKEELVDTCRVLYNFAKEHEKIKIESGFLDDKVLDNKDIERLAKLPSKEVLRAQVVMTLNSPLLKLAITLNQILRNFVYCLDQIRQKKGN
jgi:large subunit ribosomal protein L10